MQTFRLLTHHTTRLVLQDTSLLCDGWRWIKRARTNGESLITVTTNHHTNILSLFFLINTFLPSTWQGWQREVGSVHPWSKLNVNHFFTNLQSIPAPPTILQIHFQHLWSWQSCSITSIFYWATHMPIKTLLAKTNQKNVLNLICMCARLFLEWMAVKTHPRQFNVCSIYCSSCRKQNKS